MKTRKRSVLAKILIATLSIVSVICLSFGYVYVRGHIIFEQVREKRLSPSNFSLFYLPGLGSDVLADAVRQTFPRGTPREHVNNVMTLYSGAYRQGNSSKEQDVFRYVNPLLGDYFGTTALIFRYDERGNVDQVTGNEDLLPLDPFDPARPDFKLSDFDFGNYQNRTLVRYVLRELLHPHDKKTTVEKVIGYFNCPKAWERQEGQFTLVKYNCEQLRDNTGLRRDSGRLDHPIVLYFDEASTLANAYYKNRSLFVSNERKEHEP